MDGGTMASRIAEARIRAGMTQAQLASMISLDRSALAKIEAGDRRVSALELARLAVALDVRIEWFVEDEPPALISHRNAEEPGAPGTAIDLTVQRLAHAVEFVREHDKQFPMGTAPQRAMPTRPGEVERLAAMSRDLLGVPTWGPLTQLAEAVSRIGLLSFSLDLGSGHGDADAAAILLGGAGVALINGARQVGRRRLALAHELGHYLVADDYTIDWRIAAEQGTDRRERMFDRYARALLLPAASVREEWPALLSGPDGSQRAAAIQMASQYRVDMSTLARRLTELRLLDNTEAARVRCIRTSRADIVELNLVVSDELAPPMLPREYELAVLRLYRAETISTARALDLLLDTWDEDMLPELPRRSEDAIWHYV